ncbi:MAG TPA: ATP F0F1 synthase subunit B [Rhizomicrobium sp.]|nr:ATP F0F1 synthase subunit B [Rhizomicrobium sp.]
MELLQEPELWVGVGFVMVVGLLLYVGVPKLVGGLLDARSAAIKAELDEARRLREEAHTLLEGFKQKAAGAEKEAEAIVVEARAEAERFAAESRASLKTLIERRAKAAQDKIAQAEAAALAEIRTLSADAAAAAAQKLIAARMDAKRTGDLIAASIKDLPSKLN